MHCGVRARSRVYRQLLLGTLFLLPGAGRVSAALPTGFEEVTLVSGLSAPTALEWLPDGRILIAEKAGTLRVVKNGALLGTPVLSLVARSDSERGLLGIAVDPSFSSNGYLYLYYTATTGSKNPPASPKNRVSRFTMSGDTAALSSEVILVDGIASDAGNHNAGCLKIGPDQKLYISTGDGGQTHTYSQDLGNLSGKILRINLNGTIPSDNPFVGQGGARGEIWCYGLRNPWRFNFHPTTGVLYIGDVGENTWEEVNRGVRGGNYGWPNSEGPTSTYVTPWFYYNHNGSGASITGGSFLTGSAYPAAYQGSYFYGDYVDNYIRRLAVDGSGNVVSDNSFQTSAPGPVEIRVSSTGEVHYLSISAGTLVRIRYVGATNRNPIALSAASPTSGPLPLTVSFSSAGSSDPDGDTISYAWNFGDNTTSTSPNPSHVYNMLGTYTVTLTVSDGRGGSASATPLTIRAGNRAPTATIQSPVANARYREGDTINFAGSASDPEDATVPANRLVWTVVFHHADHTHPFLSNHVGASGSFQIPHTDDFPTWYEIIIEATDSGGAKGSARLNIYPVVTDLSDDFNDNVRDPARWDYGTVQGGASGWDSALPVLEQNQRLEISPRANVSGSHYNGYLSALTWNLTNANASVEVVQVPNGTANAGFAVAVNNQNFYLIETESGRIHFTQVIGGTRSETSIAYSNATHRFWRIRHNPSGDAILFETSPDRVNWTVRRTVTRQLAITNVRVEMSAGAYQSLAAPGTAIFDNFRLAANSGNQAPVANPGGPYSAPVGQAIAFTGSGSADPDGSISGYQWSFGDGGTATGAGPSHSYAAAGTYTVTLTVTDNSGATSSATTTANITTSSSAGLVDDFNDNTRDTAKWTFGTNAGAVSGSGWDTAVTIREQNQRLEISPRTNVSGSHYNGYLSAATWNLTNAAASVEVVQIAGGGAADTALAIGVNNQNFYLIETESGRLYFAQVIGGTRSETSIAYSNATHRFWRIRHNPSGDVILFETSSDGVNWTMRRSVTRQLGITVMRVELTAGTWQSTVAPGTAIFDNFRLQ